MLWCATSLNDYDDVDDDDDDDDVWLVVVNVTQNCHLFSFKSQRVFSLM